MKVINRLRQEKRYLREQIHKIIFRQDPVTKEWIYDIYNDTSKPYEGFTLDKDSGKVVWDWYYNEGEWKQEEIK